jgi:hypothetical protein
MVSATVLRRNAQDALKAARKHDVRLDLISMALHGKRVNFDKVLGMIDDMVKLLGQEQVADDEKKTYCQKEFDSSEDEQKSLERSISDLVSRFFPLSFPLFIV